jgi:uncharacterized ion transporter superfamily protein YfcC
MSTLPRLQKILSVLLICALLVPFALAVAAEVAGIGYVNLLLLIVLLVVIAFGVGLYYNSKRRRPPSA